MVEFDAFFTHKETFSNQMNEQHRQLEIQRKEFTRLFTLTSMEVYNVWQS